METLMDSLSCINAHHSDDELLKEKEDELLYGAGVYGDEEDALSDDSIRLRVSDDDEPEDVFTPISDDIKMKSELTTEKTEDVQPSVAPENDTSGCDVNQEEHNSGNVSMDEKIINDHEKDIKVEENGDMKSPVASISHCPWPSYESQWRFTSFPRNRLFHNVNRFPYSRHNYSMPNEYYRIDSYNCYNRFDTFPNFKRGRGGGICSPYYRGSYNERNEKKLSKSITNSKPATPTEYNQTFVSSCNKNISPINKSVSNYNNLQDRNADLKSQTVKNNALDNESLSKCKKNNSSLSESVDKEIKAAKTDDKNTVSFNNSNETNSLELNKETTFPEENEKRLKALPSSKDIETTDLIGIDTGASSDMSVENVTNSSINLQDSNNESSAIVNAKSDACHFNTSDNSKKMETLNKNVQHKSDTNNSSECIDKDDATNEGELKTNLVKSDSHMNECDEIVEITEISQISESEKGKDNKEVIIEEYERPKLSEDKISVGKSDQEKDKTHSEILVNGTVVTHEEEEEEEEYCRTLDDNDSTKTSKLNEPVTHDIHTINTIIFGNLENNEKLTQADENIKKSTKNSISKSETRNEQKPSQVCQDDDSTICETIIEEHIFEDQSLQSRHDIQKHDTDVKENVGKTGEKENLSVIHSVNKQSKQTKDIACKLEKNNLLPAQLENDKQKKQGNLSPIDGNSESKKNDSDVSKKNNADAPATTQRRRRRTKRLLATIQENRAADVDKQVRESGRQKRRTAKNAEEIIRKKFLNHDSDLESSDGSEKFVTINRKMSQDARSLSPPSLKRNCPDIGTAPINGSIKKVKINSETVPNKTETKENNSQNIKELNYVHKFFQRDLKEKLPKLKQEELEELLIQKIVESITMRGEIGRLREQARISEKNQEATRARCQQLTKQMKDFEMVLTRNAADRRANNDKPTAPIKINRSVGLQVNFMTEHGMQNLRQIQQNSSIKSLNVSNGGNTSSSETNNNTNIASPRRGIKVRSPRRIDSSATTQANVVPPNHTQSPPIMSTVTPAALVVTKPVESQHPLTLPTQTANVQQLLPNQQTHPQQQSIVLNGKLANQVNRQNATINVAKSRTNDLIDLTDEEEKSKTAVSIPVVTTAITDQQVNITQKSQPCFQRVIQAIPGSVAITSQPASIRVVQPSSQPTPTALVNNMNAPRLAYVMQSNVGPARQLLIAPNTNQMRPATSCNRPSFSTLTYKPGMSTVANGTVRVLTTPTANVQVNKHPAALPDARSYAMNPIWKLPPPAPSLKISKVANGIVLSWNMNLSDKYADIASYQLYAYQEVTGIPPSTSLWKKVGDVRALPLPMACTLTQFSEGNNYYFAVRAVDTHSRKGQYSMPGNISL